MKEIILNQRLRNHNFVALVDDEDYDSLNIYKWYAHKEHNIYYAVRNIRMEDDKRRLIRMHRQILNFPLKSDIDHINRNGLDNRRDNLRICYHKENLWNRPLQQNNSTGFKGVSFDKNRNKWMTQIVCSGIKYMKGFNEKKEAIEYYNIKALELHGQYAYLNNK